MPTSSPSLQNLERALAIAEQIEKLELEFAAVLGDQSSTTTEAPAAARRGPKPERRGGKRFFSAEARANMAAAARARYAKRDGAKAPTVRTKKRVLSPEGRA